MVTLGVILILIGIVNLISLFVKNNSPFDSVDTTIQELDENNDFIPLLQPEDTPNFFLTKTNGPEQTDIVQTPEETGHIIPTLETDYIPDRVVIPAINLDAPVVPIHSKLMHVNDQTYQQWLVPNKFAAGWHDTSARLGVVGNTVLNGHHNVYGKVFEDLVRLEKGDEIDVYSGEKIFKFIVDQKLLLPERFQKIEKRAENAKWIMTTEDERLTLVTCWPLNSNTHRVIIVAFPMNK